MKKSATPAVHRKLGICQPSSSELLLINYGASLIGQPLLSVLIANYNNGSYLEDCLQSIFAQTYSNWEIVIVDDASTDGSQQIYGKYASHPRIRIFYNQHNKGCGFTKRKCVEHAKGEICGFVDPDDALMPDALEIMLNVHLGNPNSALVNSKFYYTDMGLKIIKEGDVGEGIPHGYSYLTYGKWAITHFATFKKKFYDKTIGINPEFKMAVDQDLYYKLEEVGQSIFVNKHLYLYRVTPQSISKRDNGYNAHNWHFRAVKDAYNRRLTNGYSVQNLTAEQIKYQEFHYLKQRMAYEISNKKYISKYQHLFKLFLMFPLLDIKYKVKCLLFPHYS